MYISIGLHRLLEKPRTETRLRQEQNAYVHLGKAPLPSYLFAQLRQVLFSRRNQKGNLAFSTTKAEDTHLTLAAIPFQAGVNNTLIFAITNMRGKNCRVSVPVGSIILWLITL